MFKFRILFLAICCLPIFLIKAQDGAWEDQCKSSKTVGNLRFTFPSEVSVNDRLHYIDRSLKCISECLALVEENVFADSIEVEFLRSRAEMAKYLGWPAAGMAYPDRKTMFCIVADKTPIKHEWMHMITMLKWGEPSPSLTWMNEGLATYADHCSPYSNEEIYAYFIRSGKLISIEGLVHEFYKQDDVISYFQAAYLVEYLLGKYGVAKFRELWKGDITQFDKVYGRSLSELSKEIEGKLLKQYPAPMNFDWNLFEKGCY